MSFLRSWYFRVPAALLALLLIGGVLFVALDRQKAHRELKTVLDELDAGDPGWRLEQIEASRRAFADRDNGALVVIAANRLLPGPWEGKSYEDFEDLPPPLQASPETVKKMDDELMAAAAAVGESRKMVRYLAGRFAIEYSPDFISTELKDQQSARTVVSILMLDAYRAIERKDLQRAMEDVRAMIHVGRCFEGEPMLISQLIRVAIQAMAAQTLERTFAHGEVPEAELATMQKLLEEEAAGELFATGLRGERAGMMLIGTQLANSPQPVTAGMGKFADGRTNVGMLDHLVDPVARTIVIRSHGEILRYETDALKLAAKPGFERYRSLRDFDAKMQREIRANDFNKILARMLLPAVLKIAEAEQREDNQLHCAAAALAAERFRLANKRWPKDLQELVEKKYLAAVPEDLYSGNPLKFRAAADGIVIHSVGKDGTYAGNGLDRPEDYKSYPPRPEFRLWDMKHRRQPPLLPKKKEEGDEP